MYGVVFLLLISSLVINSTSASSRLLISQQSSKQDGSSALSRVSSENIPFYRQLKQAYGPYNVSGGGGASGGGSTPGPEGTTPGAVSTFHIAAGGAHSCALNSDGAVWCFGSNDKGQLGNGTVGGSSPEPVLVSTEKRFTWLTAGLAHTCALAMDATAWCWGSNEYGQIGSANTTAREIPQPTPVAGGGAWSSLSAGTTHTCGTHVNGQGWCWGQGITGQLGDGSIADIAAAPVRVAASDVASSAVPAEQDVWDQIEAGNGYSCGLRSDGKLACWGSLYGGQLGFNSVTAPKLLSKILPINGTDPLQTTPKVLKSTSLWQEVSTGLGHVTCAVNDQKDAYCWGDPKTQLGSSEPTTATLQAAAVAGNALVPVGGSFSWKSISVGGSSTCGIAFGGQAMCFGNNTYGQLGIGSNLQYQYEPTAISSSDGNSISSSSSTDTVTWEQISVGAEHACGVQYSTATAKRTYLCWGQGGSGELGSGSYESASSPVAVLSFKSGSQTTITDPNATTVSGTPPIVVPTNNGNNQTSSDNTGGSSSESVGVIVGATIGGVVLIACIILLAVFLHRRRKRKQQQQKIESIPGFAKRLSEKEVVEYASLASELGKEEDRPVTMPSEYLSSGSIPSISVENSLTKATLGEEEEDPVLSWIIKQSLSSSEMSLKSRKSGSSSSEMPLHVQPWEFTWDEVTLMQELARGSYGRVYLSRKNEATVAMKVFVYCDTPVLADTGAYSTEAQSSGPVVTVIPQHLAEEASILASLRHPHIVNFLGFCLAPPAIAFEYCARGSVYDVLRAASVDAELAKDLTWARRVGMAIDAATGMHHLHSRTPPIVHCDLKSPNLLVAKDWVVKVGDFNLSKLQSEPIHSSEAASGGPGNPRWLAPEVLEGKRATQASDVYSFGIILWELLTWAIPWSNTNQYMVSSIYIEFLVANNNGNCTFYRAVLLLKANWLGAHLFHTIKSKWIQQSAIEYVFV